MDFTHIDWALLAKQKLALIEVVDETKDDEKRGAFLGLLNLLDAIQDAAAEEGHPVVWLTEGDDDPADAVGYLTPDTRVKDHTMPVWITPEGK